MTIINDPSGQPAYVDIEGNLRTLAITVTAEHHANHHEGEMYSWYFTDDADANDDCIFYLKNLDDKDLVLEGVDIGVSDAVEISMHLGGLGTINAAATEVTGANLNAGSGSVPDVEAYYDGDIQGGAATFTGGRSAQTIDYIAAQGTEHFNFVADIIVPKNKVFSIFSSTAAIIVKATVYGYFHANGNFR